MKISFKHIVKGALLVALCGLSLTAFSQSRNPLTQYNRLPYFYNPAATGAENLTEVTLGTRYQWASADVSPKSYFLGVNHSFQKEPEAATKFGLGGFVVQEDLGITSETQVGISSAVHVPVSQQFFLSLGFKVNYGREGLNTDQLRLRDMEDPNVQRLMTSGRSDTYLDIAPGLMLHSNNFFVGYSALQLVRTQISEMVDTDAEVPLIQTAMIGYVYRVNDEWEVSPTVLAQMVEGIDPSFTALAKVRYLSKFWVGAGFSTNEAISALVGFAPSNHFNVSYSFDSSIGDANTLGFGTSHELILGFPIFGNGPGSLLWK